MLLAGMLLAQFATILHTGDHDAGPQQATCTLCMATGHLSGPPLVEFRYEAPAVHAPVSLPEEHRSPLSDLVYSYRSRAPPQHA